MNKLILLSSLIILLIVLIVFKKRNEQKFTNPDDLLKNFIYYDENNKKIDHFVHERTEQDDALEFIEPDDIVLELGGRYGTVSSTVAYKQNNSGNLVVVEPDSTILPALKNNRKINKSNYIILDKYISNNNKQFIFDGYASRLDDGEENNSGNNSPEKITYSEFKKQYPFNFNVLIGDCEGCLCDFVNIMGNDILNYNKVLFEADQSHMCDYTILLEKLQKNGFEIVRNTDNFRYVLIKK